MSRGRSRAILATTAFSLSTAAYVAPAVAQNDKKEAAKLYKEGVEAYFGADYGVAITKFREGFELDPNAMFLYNLSLCFSKLGNFEEALDHAERAQEMGGMPDEATTKNKARLASFGVLLESEERALAIEKQRQQAEKSDACTADADCSGGQVCDTEQGICIAEVTDPKDPPSPLFTPIGWSGVALGGIGIGLLTGATLTSIALGPDIETHERLLNDDDPSNDAEAEELGEELTRRQNRGRMLLFSGAAATTVGVGLIVVDLLVLKGESDENASRARLMPSFSESGAGFTFTTRF